jgi:hypothetical protein
MTITKSFPMVLSDGQTYNLCVEIQALAAAEEHYRANGHLDLSLILALPFMGQRLDALMKVFVCSLHSEHPDLSFEKATSLLDIGNYAQVLKALVDAFPKGSPDTEEANRNLCFDLASITDAAEHFSRQGDGVRVADLMNGLNLAAVRSLYPCALHKARPELNFNQAQKLMNLESVYAVGQGVSDAWQAASPAMRDKFSLAVNRWTSWTGIAHA